MWLDPASKAKKLPFYEFLTTVIIGNILRVGFRLLPVGISNFAPGYNKVYVTMIHGSITASAFLKYFCL
jgi:hypothetical protein